MTEQAPRSPDRNFPPPSFADPAFEPQAGFDFEESNDEAFRNIQNDIASMSGFGGYNMMDTASGSGAPDATNGTFPVESDAFSQGMSFQIDPANVWGQTTGGSTADPFSIQANGGLSAGQDEIVLKRGDSVTQKFGQITPPDENAPMVGVDGLSKASSHGGPSKMDKSQRARNAAIQRHAKSKKAREALLRRDSMESHDDGSDDDTEDKREKYREKNRVAAAKCRAKKKENVEGLEERHRDLSANNSWMKREERILRDQLTQLRTMALQHNKESCACHNIHGYNSRKASEVAIGWNQPVSSPSDMGSMSNAPSPGTFHDLMGRNQPIQGAPTPRIMNMPARPQSFAAPSNYAFAQVTTPQSMQETMSATAPADDAAHPFSSYLQSSPGGRAGFS